MNLIVAAVTLLSISVGQTVPQTQLTLRCEMENVLGRPDGVDFYSIDFNRRMWCRMVAQQCGRLNDLYGADATRIKLSAGVEIDRMTGRLTNIIDYRNGQCSPVSYQPLPSSQRF
ncbi:MAG: hypothetical protein O3B99_00755 [Proteobacteria bacterium]|nr:hypothetical protein [Pseudomonadota bacterium]MDA1320806.1 hypothetical protein [Pseudomonadota bacterium]